MHLSPFYGETTRVPTLETRGPGETVLDGRDRALRAGALWVVGGRLRLRS